MSTLIRRAAVAGTWYPATAGPLSAEVAGHIAAADADRNCADDLTELVALIAPHAGLRYSGPVAAHAYRLLRGRRIDRAVLVGPSHFVAFDGVSIYDGEGFDTPFGVVRTDRAFTDALMAASRLIRADVPAAHQREHSLEMQLPFLRQVAPEAKIVALVMGRQSAETIRELGDVLGAAIAERSHTLLIASTDLSHFHDAATAARLDAVVADHLARFDHEGLQRILDDRPDHACGGGPMVSVMRAAWTLGARNARILHYADSGDVSGDKSSVVGYLAGALGTIGGRR